MKENSRLLVMVVWTCIVAYLFLTREVASWNPDVANPRVSQNSRARRRRPVFDSCDWSNDQMRQENLGENGKTM